MLARDTQELLRAPRDSDFTMLLVEELDGGPESEQSLLYAPDKFFEISITGESLGITHTVKAVAIVQDGKVRYIRWQEDP